MKLGDIVRLGTRQAIERVNVWAKTVEADLRRTIDSIGGSSDGTFSVVRLTNKDSPYVLKDTDGAVFCDTDGGAMTVLLPRGTRGKRYKIINSGTSTNDVTLTPHGGDLLKGSSGSQTISDSSNLDLIFENTEGWA